MAKIYNAKKDGSVDILENYGGTGAPGGATTLNKDLFHQHGNVQVMQSWEKPYMDALAVALVKHISTNADAIIKANGKIAVLEVGFGLGLSATKFQEEMVPLVKKFGRDKCEHHIIELNDDVFGNLKAFAAKEAELGRATVVPHHGNWKDVVEKLKADKKHTFSGFLYDPFPTHKEEQHYHQLMFISENHAGPLLQKGGALVYCNLTSLGVLLADRAGDWAKVFSETQTPYLTGKSFKIFDTNYKIDGFAADRVSYSLFEITNDMKKLRKEQECNYYGGDIHNHMLVPVCVKGGASSKL
jgi:hypothetical protein